MPKNRKLEVLTELPEALLRRQVLIPLLRKMGYSQVYETHGASEIGKDLIFTESTKLGESLVCAAVVSTVDLTGTVGSAKSVLRILDQIQLALREPVDHKFLKKRVLVERCLVFTSGRMLQSATSSILQHLNDSNLAKVVSFVDGERLVELLDQYHPEFWGGPPTTRDFRGRLEISSRDPDQNKGFVLWYELSEAILENLTSGSRVDVKQDLSCNIGSPLWSPTGERVAIYSWYKRGGRTVVFKVADEIQKHPQRVIEVPALQSIARPNRPRTDFEEPVLWSSDGVLLLRKTGAIQFLDVPDEFLEYEYDIELSFAKHEPQLVKIQEVTLKTTTR